MPVVGEAQEEAEFVEAGIGLGQAIPPGGSAPGLGFQELLGEVERGAEQAGGDGGPEGPGERFALRDEPLQKIEYTSEDDEVFHEYQPECFEPRPEGAGHDKAPGHGQRD